MYPCLNVSNFVTDPHTITETTTVIPVAVTRGAPIVLVESMRTSRA